MSELKYQLGQAFALAATAFLLVIAVGGAFMLLAFVASAVMS